MDVTLLGIEVFKPPIINLFELDSIIALQLLRESNTELLSSIWIVVRFVQKLKAFVPIYPT